MKDKNVIGTDLPLTEDERDLLRPLVKLIIPPSEEYGIPGADDVEIFSSILAKGRELEHVLKQGLAEINERAQLNYDQTFYEITDEQRTELTADLQKSNSHFVRLLTSITLQAYYQDKRVIESLDMEARPPFPEGNELEQGDWSLLDPVKNRDKFYRET